eukprot:13718366-Alexandrium_andersonii.AAC.1
MTVGGSPALRRTADAEPCVGRQLHGGCFSGPIQVDKAAPTDSQEQRVTLEEDGGQRTGRE